MLADCGVVHGIALGGWSRRVLSARGGRGLCVVAIAIICGAGILTVASIITAIPSGAVVVPVG